jgi:beta-mannanase
MNGVNANGAPWASYGGDPNSFKAAYKHIKAIFSLRGISSQAWWVFAPNGWSIQGQEFENYYPGDSNVDVVGFSSYNYGFCQVAYPWQRWENYDTLYKPYLSRMASMAPGKPVILTQTGTTAQYQNSNFDINAKNIWLRVNYEYLSKEPQVLGIMYYDYDQSSWECNWKVTSGGNYSGYHDGVSYAPYRYLSSGELQSIIP